MRIAPHMIGRLSGQLAEGTEQPFRAPATLGRALLKAAFRPPLLEHAGDVAGFRDALDRRGREVDDRLEEALREFDGVIDEGAGELDGERLGLHLSGLRVNLNNVHVSRTKMNTVQEEFLRDQKNLGGACS